MQSFTTHGGLRGIRGLAGILAVCLWILAGMDDSLAQTATSADGLQRGAFVQQKYLAEMAEPLVSRGEFLLSRDQGLIWRIQAPVESITVITREALRQFNAGQQTLALSAGSQPGLNMVAAVMLGIFEADEALLEEHFEIRHSSGEDDSWQLDLRPRANGLKQRMQAVQIRGDRRVREVHIEEPAGDRSIIRLQNYAETPAPLQSEELSLLRGGRTE